MFRRLLAMFRSPVDPQAAHDDAYNEADEWAEGHNQQYPSHIPYGPDLNPAGTAYVAGCTNRDHRGGDVEHVVPIGG